MVGDDLLSHHEIRRNALIAIRRYTLAFVELPLAPLVVALGAVLAKPVSVRAGPSLIWWYVAARRARAVVVVYAVCGWLRRFVDGVEISYCWHLYLFPFSILALLRSKPARCTEKGRSDLTVRTGMEPCYMTATSSGPILTGTSPSGECPTPCL